MTKKEEMFDKVERIIIKNFDYKCGSDGQYLTFGNSQDELFYAINISDYIDEYENKEYLGELEAYVIELVNEQINKES